MVEPKKLLDATLDVGKTLLRPADIFSPAGGPRLGQVLVPIRSLGANHRARIENHLLSLDAHDRYLRFGYAAQDTQIRSYVAQLDFERDEIFGIYNRKLELIAMAHLAMTSSPEYPSCAEFGVSVLPSGRGKGLGARLFERAAMHAANDGVSMMFIHALSENKAMLSIARKAGATVQREGGESEAYLVLPSANLGTRVSEAIEEQLAQTDYHVKVQAKQFWSFLEDLQEIRRGAINAQKNQAP